MTTALTVEGAFDDTALRRIVRDSARHTGALLGPAVVVAAVGAPLILRVFGTNYAEHGSLVLRLVVAAAIPNAIVQLAVGTARVTRQTTAIFTMQAVAAVLAIGLSTVLLPREGIEGAGIAWLASQGAVAVLAVLWILRPAAFSSCSLPLDEHASTATSKR